MSKPLGERYDSIVGKSRGPKGHLWESYIGHEVRRLEQTVRRLRTFLNELGYPDTAIDVMLDASILAESADNFEVDLLDAATQGGDDANTR